MPSLAELAEAYREAEYPHFESVREELCSKVDAAKNEAARSARKFYISMGVALLGIIVTIALTLIF